MRFLLCFFVIVFFSTSIGLFQVKSYVQELNNKLLKIQRDISELCAEIGILEAEWNYLNRPDRLEGLASKYLNDRKDIILAQQVYTDFNLLRDDKSFVAQKID